MGDFAKVATQAVGVAAAPFTGGASLWLTAAATGAEVYGQQQSAGAQQVQLKLQERQEKLAAGDREVQRQRRLNAILGSQNAAAAAAGVINSGSVANVSMADARLAAEDSLVDQVNTRTRLTALRSERRAVRRSAYIKSAGTVFSAGRRIAGR